MKLLKHTDVTDPNEPIEFQGKPLFVQKITYKHKFNKLKIGDACTIKQGGIGYRVKLIKKQSLQGGRFFGLMFELS